MQLHILECLDQQLRDHQVAMPLAVGRNHVPRRVGSRRGPQRFFIRTLVDVPFFPHGKVADAEFPVLVGLVDARLEPLALLVLADVKHALEDHRAGFGQQPLEVVDVGIAPIRRRLVHPSFRHRHQHVFVVTAVPHAQLASARDDGVASPQKIVCLLGQGGRLECGHLDPEWRCAGEHPANRAVLAAGVHALQDQQQLALSVGMQ